MIGTKELLQFSCSKHLNKDYNLVSRSIVCSWVRKVPFYASVWWHGPALGVPGEHQEHPQSFLPAQLTHPSSPLLRPAPAAEPGRATGISVPTAQGANKVLWQRAHRRVIFPLCLACRLWERGVLWSEASPSSSLSDQEPYRQVSMCKAGGIPNLQANLAVERALPATWCASANLGFDAQD